MPCEADPGFGSFKASQSLPTQQPSKRVPAPPPPPRPPVSYPFRPQPEAENPIALLLLLLLLLLLPLPLPLPLPPLLLLLLLLPPEIRSGNPKPKHANRFPRCPAKRTPSIYSGSFCWVIAFCASYVKLRTCPRRPKLHKTMPKPSTPKPLNP